MKKSISFILSIIMLISVCLSVPVMSYADDCEHTNIRIELRYDETEKKYYAIEVCESCGATGDANDRAEVTFQKNGDSVTITVKTPEPQSTTVKIYELSQMASYYTVTDAAYNQLATDLGVTVKQLKCKHESSDFKLDYDSTDNKFYQKQICSNCSLSVNKSELKFEKSGDNVIVTTNYNGNQEKRTLSVMDFVMSAGQIPMTDAAKSQLAKVLGVPEKAFNCKHQNFEQTIYIKNGYLYGYTSCKDCGIKSSEQKGPSIKKDGNKYVITSQRSDGGVSVTTYTKEELIYAIVSTKELSDESRKSFASYIGVSASSLAYNPKAKKPSSLNKKSIASAKITGISNKAYTGKSIKQNKIKVVVDKKTLKQGTDYKLVYAKNKAIGKATVKIVGIGNYRDAVKKTFKIVPAGVAIKKVTPGKKAIQVVYNKGKNINGYQVQYSTNKKFKKAKTVNVKKKKTAKVNIKKLTSKKAYYVRVRTYKKVGKAYYYSKWSKVKAVKTK